MFADDTDLFISDPNIANLFETINEELRKVATWFKVNNFSLNISKGKCSLFHSTRKKKKIYQVFYLHCTLTTFQSKENSSQKTNGNTPSIFRHIYTVKPIHNKI